MIQKKEQLCEELKDCDVLLEQKKAQIKENDYRLEELTKFEKQLKEALKTEDYEMAAVCRDKIRALKAGKGGQVHE